MDNLSEKHKTITEIFKQNDFKTIWIGPLEIPHLSLERGFERGFDIFLPPLSIREKGFDDLGFITLIKNNQAAAPKFRLAVNIPIATNSKDLSKTRGKIMPEKREPK